MRMSPSQMYDRVLAGDRASNGRFFFGVSTTGIYCLPSCAARKPRRQNVRFFPTCKEARAAGFRACRKCHPDDFARGADPLLEAIERLVAEIRTSPANFPDTGAVVRRSGFGSTRLFELFREHYHATPADVLRCARLDVSARHLLGSDAGLATVAAAAGFESLSVFHAQFRRQHGLTPTAYRALRDERECELTLPAGYPLPLLRRALGRDPGSASERLTGDRYEAAVSLGGRAAHFTLDFKGDRVRVRGSGATGEEIHAVAAGLLGLGQDAAGFSRLARRLGLGRLVAGRAGLCLGQTPSVFDGLMWAVIGQQINLAFAFTVRRRLFELAGTRLAGGMVAPPGPAAVAALRPSDLRPLQFSQRKAEVLIGLAQLFVDGKLTEAGLRSMSATRAERTLLTVHGLGPWSVNYVMMRSLGHADCVPYGDTGVTSGLQALLKPEERPDVDATKRLMTPFSPHRSLATAHLWQFKNQKPE